MLIIHEPIQFSWDEGNISKNLIKHKVSMRECEEVFFDNHKKILKDVIHSKTENRYIILGKTQMGRLLFIVCTMRKKQIRIISARDLNKKEQYLYEETT